MSGFAIKFLLSFLIVFLFLENQVIFPQCCSTGSPVGASIFVGVLNRQSLRVNLFYRYNYSDTYYQGNEKTEENTILNYSRYNFTGLSRTEFVQ
jgi:hypothetical protein